MPRTTPARTWACHPAGRRHEGGCPPHEFVPYRPVVVPLSSRHSIGLLIALLVVEIGAVAALRSVGWVATGSGVRWFACLLAATLPLAIAAVLLVGSRFRFSLRTLLVITALVAVFLVVTGIPLGNAIDARRVTRRLNDSGAELWVQPPHGGFLEQIGHPVRANFESKHRAADLAPWLRPLAGDLLNVSANDEVREIVFDSDEQIAEFVADHAGFGNLDGLWVFGNVTPKGLRQLAEALPELPPISQASVSQISAPPEYLAALVDAHFLMLESPFPFPRPTSAQRSGSYRRLLGPKHFAAVAALPKLKVLFILGHDIADADVGLLANSESLEYIVLRRTTASEAAAERLREQLPDCRILLQGDE
jgi:hypothetical protein